MTYAPLLATTLSAPAEDSIPSLAAVATTSYSADPEVTFRATERAVMLSIREADETP